MIESLLVLLIYIIIIGAVLWLATVLIDAVPMEATYKQVAKGVILVVGIIILILLLIRYLPALPGGLP